MSGLVDAADAPAVTEWRLRLCGAAMLAVAAVYPLVPDPGPLCPLRRVTGVPCPFCGMTTGVVDAVHGHPAAAVAANPASLAVVALVVVAWVLWLARRPEGTLVRALQPLAWPPGIALAMAGLWVFELVRFGRLG